MRNPHFYAFCSRLGMQNPPIGKPQPNVGVEDAPNYILSNDYLTLFSHARVDKLVAPFPEQIATDRMIEAIVENTIASKKLIEETFQNDETQVVIGGDNSVTFPSILAVLDRYQSSSDVGYVQIDSHGDMNTYHDSISKNWHGMYLRPLFSDDFDIEKINALVSKKLNPKNSIFIGNLDLDPKEKLFFDHIHVVNISLLDLRNNTTRSLKQIESLLTHVKHLHLTIDIDAFDKSVAPATGLPAAQGLLYEDIAPIFEIARTSSSLSLDLVEVNPKKEGAEKTIAFAKRLLHEILV